MELPFTEMGKTVREMIKGLLMFMYSLKFLFDIIEAVEYTSLDIKDMDINLRVVR